MRAALRLVDDYPIGSVELQASNNVNIYALCALVLLVFPCITATSAMMENYNDKKDAY